MIDYRVVSIIRIGKAYNWTVFYGAGGGIKKTGSAASGPAAWNAVSAIVEPEPQPHAYPLAGKLVAEAG